MSVENFNQDIDTQPKLQDSPEYQEQLEEKVLKVEQEQQYANKLVKANDVLKVLDLPDSQDNTLRETLLKLDNNSLEELVTKSKNEIQTFLVNKNIEQDNNIQKQINQDINNKNLEQSEQLQEIQKLKSILTPEILQNFSSVKSALESGNIDEIIKSLQDNLSQIVEALGGVGSENYETFKSTLLSIDEKAFRHIFKTLEAKYSTKTIDTNEIVNSIENNSGGKIDLDLKSIPPVSRMSLSDSLYSFDKEIDLRALAELRSDIKADLEAIANGSTILNDFDKSFNDLLGSVAKVWNNEDFNTNLADIVLNFSKDIFNKLAEVYQDMDIPSELQINEFDITSLNNINSKEDLQNKIEAIQDKSSKIKDYIGNQQEKLLSNHTEDINELLQRESNEKENQLEVLKFMKNCGFDKIPKELSSKIIKNLKSNVLVIPGMNLSPQNIDLKNGHFGESSVFDSENGLTPNAKTNMVMFMNKMISGDTKEPLNVTAIVNGTIVAQPGTLRDEFNKAGIIGNLGWSYTKITENLKKQNKES